MVKCMLVETKVGGIKGERSVVVEVQFYVMVEIKE